MTSANQTNKTGQTNGTRLIASAFILLFLAVIDLGLVAMNFADSPGTPSKQYLIGMGSLILFGLFMGYLSMVFFFVGVLRWERATRSDDCMSEVDQMLTVLRSVNDRLLISDTAKRTIYRQKEHEALRKAIREDINKGSFDTALAMVTEMSKTYGYREEAEQYRDEILTARAADMQRKMDESLARLDQILEAHEWERASHEVARIQRLHPDSPRIRDLQRRVIHAREQHKRDLEREFLAAAERDDVDLAIKLLEELDRYLTPAEAEPFRETARGVIGKKRDNLGVQFKLSIHDKEWTQAVRVGEQIIRGFPNSKMADEVRGMLDLLRERAAGEQAARS